MAWVRFSSLLVAIILASTASAHVPTFDDAGSDPEHALLVEEPTKSWAFYGSLGSQGEHWFGFELGAADELYTSLSVPADEPGRPNLWIVAPGLPPGGPSLQVPGSGAMRVASLDDLSIEPFSPLALRGVAEYRGSLPQEGQAYVVVEGMPGTAYALAIGGRESFTPVEWTTVPADRISIQQWAGVPWPLAVAGEFLALVAVAVVFRSIARQNPRKIVGLMGAGAIAGTALTTLLLAGWAGIQGGPSFALVIPFIFAGVAFGLGYAAWRTVRRKRQRWVGAAIALAAVAAWAGLFIGPLLLVAWAVWPKRKHAPRHRDSVRNSLPAE